MVEFIATDGIPVDLSPDQELAMTIENPLFASDRIPVAWTTDFEGPASERNCALFGFPNAMLIPSVKREVNVEMRINSIPVLIGKLKLVGPSYGKLKFTFTGVSIEDSLTGTLMNAPFNKWNFGILEFEDGEVPSTPGYALYMEVTTSAANNTREDFATPLMIRESHRDVGTFSMAFPEAYLNFRQHDFLIPVVKMNYILQTVFPECQLDSELNEYFKNIGIVAPYRTNGSTYDREYGSLDRDADGNHILDLAQAMPNVTVVEFIENMLTAFCASLFITKDRKRIISNRSIIKSDGFVDWSDKISDDIEQVFEQGQNYEYGYSGIIDDEITGAVIDCQTIASCLNQPSGTVVRCLQTQDIYLVIDRKVVFASEIVYEKGIDLLKQDGAIVKEPAANDRDVFCATSKFTPVKCIPYNFHYKEGIYEHAANVMTPVVDVPPTGGIRPDKIQFGALCEGFVNYFSNAVQFTSNGVLGLVSDWALGGHTLYMNGGYGLYERLHKDFAEWLDKDKAVTSARVNLSANDIANLEIWKKVMLYNRLYLIKCLTISLHTSNDAIYTEAEFVSA